MARSSSAKTKTATAGKRRTAAPAVPRDTSIGTYRAKRDFTVTAEPAPGNARDEGAARMFVVQKHQAHRAGLHWDFRLEHGGVLWSWAVRKGPSLDPSVKHIAAHVEDHPIDYADFQGSIPDGQYGAGTVATWDRGTWEPVGDPASGMAKGDLTFVLHGTRLNGRFHLVRMRAKPGSRSRADNWLLFKGHDENERAGANAEQIEQSVALAPPAKRGEGAKRAARKYGTPRDATAGESAAATQDAKGKSDPPARKGRGAAKRAARDSTRPPAPGAKRGALPKTQAPQLAAIADDPPEGADWISEIKFDGYRLLAWKDGDTARLVTRNGHDWTDRLPAVAAAVAGLAVDTALLDGELVALDEDGVSSFPALQAALSAGNDGSLLFYLFDLLHLDGWDLRACALLERKRVLQGLDAWRGMLRYSDHHAGDTVAMRRHACQMKLEGIICKQGDAPYRAGRGRGWLKVKCQGREEFIVLGWTPPRGSRTGLGALHVGYYDPQHALHYAGGVGTGFSDDELATLRARLDDLADEPPRGLLVAGDPLDKTIHWVRPELVAEIQFVAWSGAGRVRHAVYLGLREDKAADEVVREVADPAAGHAPVTPRQAAGAKHGPVIAVPPRARPRYAAAANTSSAIVTAKKPKARTESIEGVNLTHPDRELWPGVSKHDLAEYWRAVADHALPGLTHRPLSIVRCPEGIDGEHFFQKRGHGHMPAGIREGDAGGQPYLAIDDVHGLVAMAQMSAIELHAWGATEADPLHPDFIVFDLDPGDGVAFTDVVQAAIDIREKLQALALDSFCRTTGGKGLHVVVPLVAEAGWDEVKPFCRAFAEMVSQAEPQRFLPTMKKADRRGRILVDWLRNGLGATAVASFCPRARPGATVATPLAWAEVTQKLDPAAFTLRSVPQRLARQKVDPWQGFATLRQRLPEFSGQSAQQPKRPAADGKSSGSTVIVSARKPKRRAQV
jgi:bifunctional non-homologous end joining protein LigD